MSKIRKGNVCPICSSLVTRVGIKCDGCQHWIHQGCAKLTDLEYSKLSNSSKPWICFSCEPPKACRLQNAQPSPELISLRNDLSSLSSNVISNTGLQKSLLEGLRLDMNSLSLAVTMAGTTQDGDSKLLHSLVISMQKEIHGLQDQLANFAAKNEKLENDMRNSTWKTVLECAEVMNRQRNLIFINIPEDRSVSPSVQRQILTKYLSTIFGVLNIPNPFPYIKRYQRVGVANGTRPRSVVVEFTLMEARDVTLSKSGLLAYSSLHHIGIVPDTPSPRKFEVLPPEPKRCCHAVLTPLPDSRPPVHSSPAAEAETAIHVVVAAEAMIVPPPTLAETPMIPAVAPKSKNGRQPLGPRVKRSARPKCLVSSIQTLPHCITRCKNSKPEPLPPRRMCLRSQKRGADVG